MPWGVAASVAGAVATSALSDKPSSGGGAGTKTEDKSPWLQAQPWILDNMTSGQNLQRQYAQNPFSAGQQQAYDNQAGQSAYMGGLIPSILGQISNQQVGFDRSNPNARPAAYNFNGTGSAGAAGGSASGGGLLGLLAQRGAPGQGGAANPPPPAPAAAPNTDFVNQAFMTSGQDGQSVYDPQALQAWGASGPPAGMPGAYTGKYGSFKYGDQPTPGTQQYRDMSAYFANGGNDPANLYGKGAAPVGSWNMSLLGGGNVGGPGSGGVGAAGGAGTGSAAGGPGW